MITKSMYIERRIASLIALDAEIERLTDYADGANDNVALVYYEAIEELQSTRDRAAKKLRDLRSQHGVQWYSGAALLAVEHAWNDLRTALMAAITATYCEAEAF